MSAALSYERLEDMPEGMRRLVERQLARKKAEARRSFGAALGPLQSASPTAPPEGEPDPLQSASPTAPPEGAPDPSVGCGDISHCRGASGRNKYGNRPTERILPNGACIKFGSKKEAAYYDSLLIQQRMGLVRKIRLQYQFLLKPAYTDGETGERFRAVSYLADFVFERYEDGQWRRVIVDTKGGKRKGTRTSTYAIKRKLMAEMGYIIEEA